MRAISYPLAPARALMDRLSFASKFVVIALVLLAPLAYVGWSYLGVQRTNTDFSSKERVGIRYIKPGTAVVDGIAKARSAAIRRAGGADGAQAQLDVAETRLAAAMDDLAREDARDGAELQTTKLYEALAGRIDSAKTAEFATPSAAYEEWNGIADDSLALVLQAGNISNLILDPDLDTYYLMDSHVIRLVTLDVLAGQAADLEQVITLEHLTGNALFERRLELSRISGSIDFNHGTLEGNYTTSLGSTDQKAVWKDRIDGDLAAYLRAYKAFNQNVTAAVHGSVKADEAATLATATEDALVQLQGSTSKQLDYLTVDRLAGFAAATRTMLIVAGIALVLAALLFGAFYQSVRSALRSLLGASERIGRGELDGELAVSSRDEIGRMADSFRVMADGLRETASAAKQIAQGDVQVEVALRGDRDELGSAFQDMVRYLQETAAVAEALSRGDVSVEPRLRSERDALGAALLETVAYLRDMSQTAGVEFADLGTHIAEQAAVADRIARGDLGTDVTPRGDGDVLGQAFRRMTENLRGVIGDISESAHAMSAASEQLSATSSEVTGDMESATAQVAELEVGATEQLRLLDQVAERTVSASEATSRVIDRSTTGRAAMGAATDAMGELERSAVDVTATMRTLEQHGRSIDDIIGTITAISDQTNLLALNAAIEAARAGDAGRGFAVVADEVRKLAEESQGAATTVTSLVASMQDETTKAVAVIERTARQATDGASLVQEARLAFDEIDEAVREAGGRVEEIARDADEAGAVTRRAAEATGRVGSATSQTTASMQEVAASSGELARLAEDLTRTTARFQLGSSSSSTTATRPLVDHRSDLAGAA
ncbi:MAG: methyl-accepting chemotaxis sensory transducer [Thermoleophilia bacterium]|nr:methyl-accepting chemotaxis sensory transducer [Thermoleophilia bacterium]